MDTRPLGDDWNHNPRPQNRLGERRCLDQRRPVTMQLKRSASRPVADSQTILMRGAVVAAMILVLGVSIATINSSSESFAHALAPAPATMAPLTETSPDATPPPQTEVAATPSVDPAATATTSAPTELQPAATTPIPPATTIGPEPGGEPGEGAGLDGVNLDVDNADDGVGDTIDPGGLDPNQTRDVTSDEHVQPDPPPPPPPGPGDCGVWGYEDNDQDGIPQRFDGQPCVADHVSAAAPCDSYSGVPVEDPFGDWDRDGSSNQVDPDPCNGEVAAPADVEDPVCEPSADGSGDGDHDGIPDIWDFDPCVPDHVSAAAPCLSYDGQPGDDPDGDWDGDGVPNATDPDACDSTVI